MDAFEAGLFRTLCFHDAWGYAPTHTELFAGWDAGGDSPPPYEGRARGGLRQALDELMRQGLLVESRGRVVFAGRESLIAEHEKREGLFPRKLRAARRVARWLSSLDGVRFVALCNTTALAHARDEGDLDFFVIVKAGTLWQTRGWATLPFAIAGRRPRPNESRRDAVCLSFFIDDSSLDLSSLQIQEDVYFRHWFLSLLPLYDDGVSQNLWQANQLITARHPLARPWIVNPDVKVSSSLRIPTARWLEPLARTLQMRALNPKIKTLMNQDTRVVVNDHVLKFHVEDGREQYREAYRKNCEHYGIDP